MTDVTVRIFKDELKVASEAICSPVTAAEAKFALLETNAAWVGKLTAPNRSTNLVGQHQLVPGKTYHLQLQQQAGKYCNTESLMCVCIHNVP